MPLKRKVKDMVSQTGPLASRARSTRTSKASPATDDNESEALPARPPKRVNGSTRAARKGDDSDDAFGNYRRASSKPATIEQHLMEQNKKSKEFIQGFKEQVAEGRDRVQETLAKLKQNLINPHSLNPDSNNDNLPDVYTTIQTAAATQTLSTKDNPLFEQTQHLLRLSRAVLKCHQTVARDSRVPEKLSSPRETWERDEEGMRKLLEYGKVFGERVVEGWITPSAPGEEDINNEDSSGEDGEDVSEAENLARGLFEWRRKGCRLKEDEESWGMVARRQMVALAGVVRTLPCKGDK